MDAYKEYRRWLGSAAVDELTKAELRKIEGNNEEIESRFGEQLAFGTAGLRGVLGAGLNRMNVYTVGQATQGLANLIVSQGEEAMRRGVVIAHDSRILSPEFALEAACVLAAAGVRTYWFDELRPTPELSFAVRELHCIAGINITASHNPKEYNGYKAYWEDGAQLPPDHADAVLKEIRSIDILTGVRRMPENEARKNGLLVTVGRDFDEKFIANVLRQAVGGDAVEKIADTFKIIYTPFHGAGYRLVPEVLRRRGFRHVLPVSEQMVLDGSFPTVKSPNPEYKEGFTIAIEMAKREDCDLIIGTDPDADRTGIVVRGADGEYLSLTGNQVGVLLTDYLIRAHREQGTLPENAALVTTIVSTRMVFEECRRNGVKAFETLTGFKFIGEKIKEFEATGEYSFLFGFEESYGYLAGTYARDKDAVVASMLIAEMAAWYKCRGMTLYDGLQQLYKEYGYYDEKTVSIGIDGLDALGRMGKMMERLRAEAPAEIGGTAVTALSDYLKGRRTVRGTGEVSSTGLPPSDVLAYELADGNKLVVRPSGTEPKIKLYTLVHADTREAAAALTERYTDAFRELLK